MAGQNLHGGKYGQGYETVDDAAQAALMALGFQPNVKNQEYMTMIFQNPEDQKYYRSDFQTDGQHDTSSWTGSPFGKIAAIVHSHPTNRKRDIYSNDSFSGTDLKNAQQMKVPNYIAAMQNTSGWPSLDRKYIPGSTQTKMTGPDHQIISPGEDFLGAFPIDEYLQYIERNRMGDTVQHSPAITAAQRKAMVEAMVNQAQERGMQPMPSPPDFTRPHAKDMGGAPRPLPPGANTFGSPMGIPPVSGQSLDAERAALIQALRARGMQQ